MSAIMLPNHPRWNEFCERLEGEEGCNFRKNKDGEIIWDCKAGTDKSKATAILEKMADIEMVDIDVKESLKYFEEHGGYCDCEILFNVGTRHKD